MGIVSKSSIKFSVILFVGIGLGYINTVLVFPNVLSEEEFGLTRILMSASAVVAQLAQLGTPNIILRFHPQLKDDRKNSTLSIGLLIIFAGLILSTIFLVIFQDYFISLYIEKSRLFTEYFYLLIPFTASLIFYNLFDAYLRVIFKNTIPAFLNFIALRILWLAVVALYYFGYFSTATFVNLYVGCQLLIAVVAFIYIVYLGKFNISFKIGKERITLLRKMYQFGAFTIISGLSAFLINRIDILMVGKYIGLEAVAVYSIAFYISTVILVPAQSISRTTIVLAADAAKNNDLITLDHLYKKTALNQLLFCSLIFTLITINYKSLIFFLPEAYHNSFSIFFLLGMAKIIDTGFGINGAIIINTKYFKIDTLLSIVLLLLTIGTNLYFIPIFGIEGAALATMISIIIFNIIRYLFLKIKLGLTPFSWEYFTIAVILATSTLIVYFIPALSFIWGDIILRTALFIILSVPAIYLLKLSPEFNRLILNFLSLKDR